MPLTAVSAVAAIAGTVGQIVDAKARRETEANLGLLDANQRAILERELQRTTSLDNRLQILSNAISNVRAAQSSAILSSTIQSKALAKSKSETTTAIIIIGGAVALLIAVVIIKKANMANTTNTQLSIVDQLKGALTDIKDKIKVGGLQKTVFDELAGSAKVIQDKLNELLSKQGLLTQSDINDAYIILQAEERKRLTEARRKKAIKLWIIMGVLVAGGIYLYRKNKS